ncbi:AtpZ/AtpI family protein [Flavobacterium sp. WC2430]|uniref:AtpZ/AtpI family protein n=1 Tax=Flavobacterium sp. WC2430 TaxID=3234137 RepID=UPI003465637F
MKTTDTKNENPFSKQVGLKEKRKLKALKENKRSIWFGLGMFGLVGWSITIPTLVGIAIGLWLDKKYPESFSWTMSFLIIGLFTGCLIAWHWVAKENKEMHQDKKQKNE